jgi:hypothetical protein
VVRQDHVDRLDLAVVPAVQGHPLAVGMLAELPYLLAVLLVRCHLVDPAVHFLRAARAVPAQAERRGRRGAEARVGEPDVLAGPDPERQVGARAGRPAVRSDAREQALDAEAETLEHRAEQLRLLVAVAAAATEDDLVLDRFQVDVDASAQEDVEVLEPDRGQVRTVEGGQHLRGCLRLPLVADSVQVGVEVKLVDGPVGVVHFTPQRGRPRPGRACS